jgi:hypothetical protein
MQAKGAYKKGRSETQRTHLLAYSFPGEGLVPVCPLGRA